jgi:hypothetical protein
MGMLPHSIFTIAPEREGEFDTSLNDYALIFSDDRKWKFCADPDPKARNIYVSRGAIELIWCASLAHYCFYKSALAGKEFKEAGELNPNDDPKTCAALKLLRWALCVQLEDNTPSAWPKDWPRPLESPPLGSDENIADEICLVACAYLLHHELAHIRIFGHSASVDDEISIAQEKEADIAAGEWILDRVDDDGRFSKRILGVTQALLLTTVYGLYGGCLGGKRHPFSYDRLTSILSRFLGHDPHVAKTFAFGILSLHFQNSRRNMVKNAFDEFEDALEAICDQLADEVHSGCPAPEHKLCECYKPREKT